MKVDQTFCHRTITNISAIRRGNLGLEGTLRNANCHAKPAIPLVELMAKIIPDLGFKEWWQGHNIHVLETMDGRQFAFRPLVYEVSKGEFSWGLRMFLKYSRTTEVPLMDIKSTEDVMKACTFLGQTTDLSLNRYQTQTKELQ
jgi:hypothetical protein